MWCCNARESGVSFNIFKMLDSQKPVCGRRIPVCVRACVHSRSLSLSLSLSLCVCGVCAWRHIYNSVPTTTRAALC